MLSRVVRIFVIVVSLLNLGVHLVALPNWQVPPWLYYHEFVIATTSHVMAALAGVAVVVLGLAGKREYQLWDTVFSLIALISYLAIAFNWLVPIYDSFPDALIEYDVGDWAEVIMSIAVSCIWLFVASHPWWSRKNHNRQLEIIRDLE